MALGRRILYQDEECDDQTQSCSLSSTPPSPPAASPRLPGVVLNPAAGSPPPVPSSPATPIQISNKNQFLRQVVVVVICVLAVCLLLLALYACYRYWSSSRRRRRRAVALAAAWGPPQAPAGAEGDLLREDLLMTGEEPYHVWYIRTVGLDQTVIGAITVCEYRTGEGVVEDTDCAVCLGEFGEGELLRLLPKCSHAFHVPCIDTWLRSHVNCPLCRAPVLAPPPARVPTSLPSPHIEGGSLVSEEAAAAVQRISRQATDGEDLAGAGNSLRRIAPEDGSEDGGNSAQVGFGFDRPAAGASFSSQESETWMSIDLGDGGLEDETAPGAAAPEEGDRDGELQPVRRSVSMDSSAMAGLLVRMRLAGTSRDGRRKPSVGEDASTNKKAGNGESNCKGESLRDCPLETARCMSGGRFSLARFSGRGGGAILPL